MEKGHLELSLHPTDHHPLTSILQSTLSSMFSSAVLLVTVLLLLLSTAQGQFIHDGYSAVRLRHTSWDKVSDRKHSSIGFLLKTGVKVLNTASSHFKALIWKNVNSSVDLTSDFCAGEERAPLAVDCDCDDVEKATRDITDPASFAFKKKPHFTSYLSLLFFLI